MEAEKKNPIKVKFRLAYKIYLLITITVISVILIYRVFSFKTYEEGMYKQLLKRSATNLNFIVKTLQAELFSRSHTKGFKKDVDPVFLIKLFRDAIKNDNTIVYAAFFVADSNRVYLFPETYKYKDKVKRTRIDQLVKYKKNYYCTYDKVTGVIEHYQLLTDNLGNSHGYIHIGVSPQIVKEGLEDLIILSLMIVAIIVVVAIFISFLFAKYILAPITILNKTAKEITRGDYVKRVVIKSSDEIAELGYSFNNMTDSLEKKINDLKAVEYLSKELTAKLNEEELLNTVAKIFGNITNTERSSVIFFNPSENIFYVKIGLGVADKHYQGSFDRGLIGKVVTTWQCEFTTDLQDSPEYKIFFEDKDAVPDGCIFLCIPLIINEELRGLIYVAGAQIKHTEEDLKLYSTLAKHAIIAIENARHYQLAITDGLTGLFLKRHFLLRLDSILYKASLENRNLLLFMIDIDHFKRVNDTYGHPEGDIVLKKIADILKSSIRKYDIKMAEREADLVCRYGGEEFVILFLDASSNSISLLANRILDNIRSTVIKGEKEDHNITLSIGVCEYSSGLSKEEFIERADVALYKAKNSGRNCYRVFGVDKYE